MPFQIFIPLFDICAHTYLTINNIDLLFFSLILQIGMSAPQIGIIYPKRLYNLSLQISKNILTSLEKYDIIHYAIRKQKLTLEKYPRGRRGSPAKGVVRESVARVQIPLSPPLVNNTNTRQSEFVLFLLYESFGVSIPIKDILPKPPIPTAWQTQKRDEQGNFTK